MKKFVLMFAALLFVGMTTQARAAMRITEWMYGGIGGEFVEFTNTGTSPIDMTGWSFDDDSAIPGVLDLSAFGTVAPGESVVISEAAGADFRTDWSLAPTVKVIGGYTNNLGRADAINLFDGPDLIDQLAYADNDANGGPRTQERSGNPITLAALGLNDDTQWQLASLGDAYGSYHSLGGDLANPGIGNYVVPEPSTVVLGVLGAMALGAVEVRRRRAGALTAC